MRSYLRLICRGSEPPESTAANFPIHSLKCAVQVGLDNAGKTTTLYKLHLGEAVITQPTAGSNVEQIQYKNLQFEVWDLGGQANLRPSWATYYRSTDALIMVVDSTDRARIGIAKVGSKTSHTRE